MHSLKSKIPIKNLVRQRCTEGFNSGVKGLMTGLAQQHSSADVSQLVDLLIIAYLIVQQTRN
jgi:hypothetical protein